MNSIIFLFFSIAFVPATILAQEEAHISYANHKQVNELSLSKSKDKFLIVAPMGSATTVIIERNNNRKVYNFRAGNLKIPIKSLSTGDYRLFIGSCHTYADIAFTITE